MRLLLVLTSILLIGCLPERLVPLDYNVSKNNLEAYIEADSITVAFQNLEIKRDYSVFGLEIENRSSKPVFINTGKIRKHANFSSFEEDKPELTQQVMVAMSPDQVNNFFKAKEKEDQAAAIFFFLVGTAISAYDIIKDEQDNARENWTKKDEKKSINRDAITSTSLLATDILTNFAINNAESSREELKYLPDELFDREIIYPGESYYGKILFRKVGELQNYHRMVFPIESDNFFFDFRKATGKERRFLHEQF